MSRSDHIYTRPKLLSKMGFDEVCFWDAGRERVFSFMILFSMQLLVSLHRPVASGVSQYWAGWRRH